ncbi:MGC53320 protein, putative [Brugia malayi]|uniref:MGC53320 protein, putative n=1 Tax=Brugia malayi TaxID=6279 RepID=A0A4E9FX45_BRUMA|nr:MGC53320 protein, putative [Brugia malayi]VIO99193.1 MGC53320 protein, putative [Brugia malayi]
MAKSIRSKSKRRVRAIKRERLAPRVLKRLQATVSNLDSNKIKMEIDNSNMATESADPDVELLKMETDSGNLNLKTMKKPDGSYPVWLSQRKIKKKKREQKIKQSKKSRKARRNR